MFCCTALIIILPISKPKTDLADALPIPFSKEIIIVGLLNLSFNLDAIIPIIPPCHLCPDKINN